LLFIKIDRHVISITYRKNMNTKQSRLIDWMGMLAWGLLLAGAVSAAEIPGNTPVYFDGGKRGHIEGCRRLSQEAKAKGPTMTLAEMEAKGGQLCSRCPGSELNKQREAGSQKESAPAQNTGGNAAEEKYGRQGARARAAWLEYPEKAYDPNTKAYCDALWMRVHEADCPLLLLKDQKEVITLEQADKEGWRIGESGQSGRERCCFKGYRRKHPEKEFTEDTPGLAQYMKQGTRLKWHQAGCHRMSIRPDDLIMTQKEAKAHAESKGLELFYVCDHCVERGPNRTNVDMAAMRKRPSVPEFTPPAGWSPKPFPVDGLPPRNEIEMLVQETLSTDYAILEGTFENPLASLEEFMGMRFFFPVQQWLTLYQGYRATGDKRILESLRISARHYRDLCNQYPEVAQLKARDPEGLAFMYSMAVSARITLQLARKYPNQVSAQELAEAESFLKAIVATLKPVVEGNSDLDPKMGIPKPLADDFRSRAFNRALNGIGTIATAAAALQDYQALNNTTALQPTIDRYRKAVQEYYKNWKSVGYLAKEEDGKMYFYYPYAATDKGRVRNGVKIFGSDDVGHFSHSMQGVMLVYEATPELGADDDFMTAIANSVFHNSTTRNGSIQSPAADRINPVSRQRHGSNPTERLYMFEAFREGLIEGQNSKPGGRNRGKVPSDYSHRLKTLHAQYMKALRKDRSLIHLGEVTEQTPF